MKKLVLSSIAALVVISSPVSAETGDTFHDGYDGDGRAAVAGCLRRHPRNLMKRAACVVTERARIASQRKRGASALRLR
jgi:hypothetical protein